MGSQSRYPSVAFARPSRAVPSATAVPNRPCNPRSARAQARSGSETAASRRQGAALRLLRRALGLTLAELSTGAGGVSESLLSRIERGKRTATVAVLECVVEALRLAGATDEQVRGLEVPL